MQNERHYVGTLLELKVALGRVSPLETYITSSIAYGNW